MVNANERYSLVFIVHLFQIFYSFYNKEPKRNKNKEAMHSNKVIDGKKTDILLRFSMCVVTSHIY